MTAGTGTTCPTCGAATAAQGAADEQLTRTDIAGWTPQQIDQARRDGRLDDLQAGRLGPGGWHKPKPSKVIP